MFWKDGILTFFKTCGLAIVTAGLGLIFINAVISPMVDFDAPISEMMASRIFLVRLSLASFTAFLLMAGSPGLFGYQASRSGLFAKIGFGGAFLGSALLFAHEWGNVFFLHNMALVAPDGLQAMNEVEGMSMLNIEGLVVLSIFALGWIAFSASMLIAKVFGRLGPILVIVGFFAIPALTAVTSVKLGGALGNAVLGSGFVLLGWELIKNPAGVKK